MIELPEEVKERVVEMKGQGIPTADIVKDLRAQGISYKQTEDALGQADLAPSPELKPSIMETTTTTEPPPIPVEKVEAPIREEAPAQAPQPAPVQQFIPQQPVRSSVENVEILIENIVEEKWKRTMEAYGDIASWKEKVRTEIISIKQELLRVRNKLETTERAIIGKVTKYDKDIVGIGSDVRALEKVLKDILKPLTSSIKELKTLTKKIKK